MAERPDLQRFRDLFLSHAWRNVDRKAQVDLLMQQHDLGYFFSSAVYVDEILTDDRIDGVLSTRIDALLAAPMNFRPASDKGKARKLAESMQGIEVQPGISVNGAWDEIARSSAIRQILRWGIMLGVGVAEIVWTLTEKSWQPRLVPWHPSWVRWDQWAQRFILQTRDGLVTLPHPEEQPRGDGKWFIYCPYGVQNGWRSALLRPLALKYIDRQWNEQQWSRYNEKHGLAILEAKVPANAVKTETDAFFDQVANLGAEGTVVSPQGDEGKAGYGLSLVEATSRSWETFQMRKQEIDKDIAIAVLGQTMTTDAGQAGSRALGQVHNLVRLDKAKRDAAFAEDVRSQVLTWWAEYNAGDPELAPHPTYQVAPEEDLLTKAQAYKALGDAVISLQTAEPRVDGTAIIEGNGLPLISEEELAAQAAAALEDAQQNPPPGTPPAPGEKDGAPDGKQPDQNDGPPQTSSLDAARAMLLRANIASGRAARFEEALLKRSRQMGASLLAHDLMTIKREVEAATSLSDMRHRLARALRGMDPHRLAKLIANTNILSHLAGQKSAHAEI